MTNRAEWIDDWCELLSSKFFIGVVLTWKLFKKVSASKILFPFAYYIRKFKLSLSLIK